MRTPTTGKGVVLVAAGIVAAIALAFAPSLLIWSVIVVLIGAIAYVIYIVGLGMHRRAVRAMEGRSGRWRRGGGGGGGGD